MARPLCIFCSLAVVAAERAHSSMSKPRWGDAEDDEDVLPENTTTAANEKGILTKTEYYHNSAGEPTRKVTKIQLVQVETRVFEVWPSSSLTWRAACRVCAARAAGAVTRRQQSSKSKARRGGRPCTRAVAPLACLAAVHVHGSVGALRPRVGLKRRCAALQVTAERRRWAKFGHAGKSNEGVTVQSVDEIMFERSNAPKKAEKEGKPENALVRSHPPCMPSCRVESVHFLQ